MARSILVEGAEHSEEAFLNALVGNNMLSGTEHAHIARLSAETAEPLDQIIAKLGLMTESAIADQMAQYLNISQFDTNGCDFQPVSEPALSRYYLKKLRLLPVTTVAGNFLVAMVNPFDEEAVSAMRFALEGVPQIAVITHGEWERQFEAFYPPAVEATNDQDVTDIATDAARLADLASAEPVIQLANHLIASASEGNASDIHIEPQERNCTVRYRIDGVLSDWRILSRTEGVSLLSRIKILSSLDIAERRRPQDGRFSFPVAGRQIDLRVSTIPTDHGESAVLRLLDNEGVELDVSHLGFSKPTIDGINRILAKPNGIFLVTGPTGSGKTTTLYSFLKTLATGDKKILTIEDPIEYRLAGISQSQVNPKIDVTFANALRSFLRHDPDVMMVGEIRDLETARIAIQAALTGHLVLSTLHTNDAASAITRLRDLGVEDYLIASTLLGVMGQRLVRRLCPACHGEGNCSSCNNSRYRGRVAVSEFLEITPAVSDAIRAGASEADTRSACPTFYGFEADCSAKLAAAETTEAELSRIFGGRID